MGEDYAKVKIKFYAILTEFAGIEEAEIQLPRKKTSRDIVNFLKKQFTGLSKIDEYKLRIIILKNGEIVSSNIKLNHNDRIEVLPLSSGG